MTHTQDADARRSNADRGPSPRRSRARSTRRASGRIRDLLVVCEAGHITIKGRTRGPTTPKQLALQAVLDVTDGRSTLADQIVVA